VGERGRREFNKTLYKHDMYICAYACAIWGECEREREREREKGRWKTIVYKHTNSIPLA